LTHTIVVLVTDGLGHGVYRKLYTLIGGQRAKKFENYWFKRTELNNDEFYCILICDQKYGLDLQTNRFGKSPKVVLS